MKKKDIKFILFHRITETEIIMPVLSICEEYSQIAFSVFEGDYNGEYDGINRLPGNTRKDTADEYDVFVEIDGERFIYDGVFHNADFSQTKRK